MEIIVIEILNQHAELQCNMTEFQNHGTNGKAHIYKGFIYYKFK